MSQIQTYKHYIQFEFESLLTSIDKEDVISSVWKDVGNMFSIVIDDIDNNLIRFQQQTYDVSTVQEITAMDFGDGVGITVRMEMVDNRYLISGGLTGTRDGLLDIMSNPANLNIFPTLFYFEWDSMSSVGPVVKYKPFVDSLRLVEKELGVDNGYIIDMALLSSQPIISTNTIYNFTFLLPTLTASKYSQTVDGLWKADGDMLMITSDMDAVFTLDGDLMSTIGPNELLNVGGKKISLVATGKTIKSKLEGCPNGLNDFTLEELRQFPSKISLSLMAHPDATIKSQSQTQLYSLEKQVLSPGGGDVVIGKSFTTTTIDFTFPLSDYTNDDHRKIVDNKWKSDGHMIHLALTGKYYIDIDIDHRVYSDIATDETIPLLQSGNKKLSCAFNAAAGTLVSKMEGCDYGLKNFSVTELQKFPKRMTIIIRWEDLTETGGTNGIILSTDEYIDTLPAPTDKPIDDIDDTEYYFEMGLMKNIKSVLTFDCDDAEEVCEFALSEGKSDKFNNVVQLTKDFYVITPHSSNHIMFYSHTTSGVGQGTKAGAWWCFPIDGYGMTGPLIVRHDNVVDKFIVLCQSTFKFIVMDVSILENLQEINLGIVPVNDDLFIYSSDGGGIFYWTADGIKTPWTSSSDSVLGEYWSTIYNGLNHVNAFPILWYNSIYTLDDVSIVKYDKTDTESNWCISFVYTPKDDETSIFPILTANINASGVIGTVGYPETIIDSSMSGEEYSQSRNLNELSPFIDTSFTSIEVIPNSLVKNIFVPGRSNFVVYQTNIGNTLTWYSHKINGATQQRSKFSSGGCINISSSDNQVTCKIFLAPKYERQIYAFKAALQYSVEPEWIACPDEYPTPLGLPLFSRAITYNVKLGAVESFVNNCIVFVPDSASHFLKIKFVNPENHIDWVPMVVRNDEEWDLAESKFMYMDYNHRHFESGMNVDRLLVNVYGGNIKRNIVVSIETIPSIEASTDNTLVIVKESHIKHNGGLAFYDPVRNITISLPDRTDAITSVAGGMFNNDVDMCSFFKFDCVECHGYIYDLFNNGNVAGSTDAIKNTAWLSAFKTTLEDKVYVDGDPDHCYTLRKILYNSSQADNLFGFTKKPVGTESLLEAIFKVPQDSFDSTGVNWCSTGFKKIYDAVKTSLYNFSNDNAVINMLNVVLETTSTEKTGWVTKVCNDSILKKPDGHKGPWNYDDEDFVARIEDIITSGTDFEMNVLGIASCWKGNYLSGALIERYIKYCRGNTNCEATFKNDYNPLCHSNICMDWDKLSGDKYGPHNYHFTWDQLCTKDITIMNCTTNIDGSLVEGEVDSCTMCGPGTMLCGDGGNNGDSKNKMMLYIGIGLGVGVLVVVIILVIFLNNKNSKQLGLQIQQALSSSRKIKTPTPSHLKTPNASMMKKRIKTTKSKKKIKM